MRASTVHGPQSTVMLALLWTVVCGLWTEDDVGLS